LVKALKRVDLPTLGKPTMPHLRLIEVFQADRIDRSKLGAAAAAAR
jgi:hypothetical protein